MNGWAWLFILCLVIAAFAMDNTNHRQSQEIHNLKVQVYFLQHPELQPVPNENTRDVAN